MRDLEKCLADGSGCGEEIYSQNRAVAQGLSAPHWAEIKLRCVADGSDKGHLRHTLLYGFGDVAPLFASPTNEAPRITSI